MSRLLCFAGSVAALALFGVVIAAERPATSKPLLLWSGPDSHVKKSGYHRITSEREWRAVWLAHVGRTEENAFDVKLPTVEIDFDKCQVLAIFRGDAVNHRGVTVESITQDEGEIRVRFDYLTFQTAGPGGGAVSASAYGFILLPASQSSVILEENVQGLKNQPAKWKERARFAAKP
jgi:hypothetical protein